MNTVKEGGRHWQASSPCEWMFSHFLFFHCTTAPSSHIAYKWDRWTDCLELLLRQKLHNSNFLSVKVCLFMVSAFRTSPTLHQYQLPPSHLSSNLSCQKYSDNCCLTSVTLLLVFASRKKNIFNFEFKTNIICFPALTCCLPVSRRQIFVVIWKAHRKQIDSESIGTANTLLFAHMKGWWIWLLCWLLFVCLLCFFFFFIFSSIIVSPTGELINLSPAHFHLNYAMKVVFLPAYLKIF